MRRYSITLACALAASVGVPLLAKSNQRRRLENLGSHKREGNLRVTPAITGSNNGRTHVA